MSRETQWKALRALGIPELGCAAILGNAEAESNCETNRVQGDFELSRAWSRAYTSMVDAGEISRDDFIFRGPGGGGYGWLQWTLQSRKAGYYDHAKKLGVSIGSESGAIGWFWEEVHRPEYRATLDAIMTGTDLQQISDTILRRFEMPADQGSAAAAFRAKKAQEFLDRFGGSGAEPEPEPEPGGASWSFDVALIQLQMARDGFWPKNRIDGVKTPEFRAAYREWSDAVASM